MTERRQAVFIPALDGLRGIAIILVILHHATYYEPTKGIDLAFGNMLLFGWSGVDLFFVLSGFLITGILLDTRDSPRYFTTFYARRCLRIFPLYYLVLLLAFVVLPAFPPQQLVLAGRPDVPPQWPYWLYLSNISIAHGGWVHGWVDVAWSLAIEEHFYLLWPLVIWLCPPRVMFWVCAALIAAEPAARVIARAEGVPPLSIYVLTWFRLDGLATGALLALAHRRGVLKTLDRWVPAVIATSFIGLVAVTILGGHMQWWNRRMQEHGYSIIAVVAGAMLISAVARPSDSLWPRMLSAGWLRAFGKYSYCLYLIHRPIILLVREYVFNPEDFHGLGLAPWNAQIVFYIAATAPAFALAWLSWRLFEAPILKLKTRFQY